MVTTINAVHILAISDPHFYSNLFPDGKYFAYCIIVIWCRIPGGVIEPLQISFPCCPGSFGIADQPGSGSSHYYVAALCCFYRLSAALVIWRSIEYQLA